ncbi:trifunctional serine/threonine-protein kinase/ATP-binding protein/sensor histidine kinase [Planktothrix paucivesiculata]|uniref:histidine kinase n=1 Tax=Planktothrix paucivesiculata PCC 9631 TaxID=671071 RepID=A0A7Z9E104_9CYAN|nr:ATP-binding sensor histidine kinase [Planktothrix paucivesiculata]VXD22028.1 Multi-sensor signal transduction multi-kinase [Planktothrix paucivesiculata PCC 9631]
MVVNLVGYEIKEQLYIGTRTVVHRGIRTDDSVTVVIKFLRNEYPTFHELVQFRNQYTIAKNLDFPHIIKPLTLAVYQNGYALVMEDFGGISLCNYLPTILDKNPQSKYLPLAEFLEIAIQLTDTLHYLYQNQIIHKDIKPANILINPDTKQIKLIDFSISSLLPKETQEIQNPNILEGTLPYLSPEQTGRMNRGIDYRSDFYSLGITFYELLTGILPFSAENAMELVHCHLAKKPKSIHQINREIPLILSKIIKKLMAKNAENRYQSALGIKYDLEKCLTQFKTTGQIEFFELGKKDITDRFLIPEKLYGREQEVDQLLAAFERVALSSSFTEKQEAENSPLSSSEIMLVAGFSGIGKTAVINEVHKPIVRQRGYFIKGKYDQFQRNIPFSGFVQAFRDLMRQLLSDSDIQLQIWKDKILAELGENGQVLIDVIPELENIIGKQPKAPELSGSAAQNRFNLLMQKFVQIFTSKDQPLVIFLDDLQWSDSASLNLLQLLMQDTGHLLILGAYRDNEVSPIHPFMLTVDQIVKSGATVNTITLPPLTESDLNRLVADTLHCELLLAQPLTENVYKKTKGNPFFATQFLKALYDEKLITFNWDIQHWQCDIANIKALSITDDVVEFMALQLRKLPRETQDVLKLAACIGSQFDLGTLAVISETDKSPALIADKLWKALEEGLIIATTEVYKFFQQNDHNSTVDQVATHANYKFLHDRVQQAAYSLIPDENKQATHLKIGQLLLKNSTNIEQDDKIFEIVRHLNQGQYLITQPEERQELAELNLVTGRKAKASTAYVAALVYLQTARELLTTECWQNQYKLTLNIYIDTAEAQYLNLDFEQSLKLAEVAMKTANSLLDKVKVYELQMQIHIAQLEMLTAVNIGLEVLEKLTISLLTIDVEKELIVDLPNLDNLDDLPTMTDPYKLAAMQILKILCAPVFMAKPEIFPQIIITMINLCLQHGNSGISSFAYGFYGLLLVGFGQLDRGYHAGLISLKLLEKFNAKELKAKVYNLFNSNIRTWKEHPRNSVNPLREAVQAGLEVGDLEWGGYCAANLSSYLFFTEDNLESSVKEQKVYIDLCIHIKQEIPTHFSQVWRQLGLNLQGESADTLLLIGESFNEAKILPRMIEAKSGNVLFVFYVAKTILLYLLGDSRQALNNVQLAQEQAGAAFGFMQVVFLNFYHSLILLNLYPTVSPTEQQDYLEIVNINQEKMKFWAENAPEVNQHKYDLVEAEKARVLGMNWQAAELYEQAILAVKKQGCMGEEGLAQELAAQFCLEWGKEHIARDYLIEAYYVYSRWGAKAKVDALEKRYPQLLAPILQQHHTTNFFKETMARGTFTSTKTSTSNSEVLDLPTLLKASQAISSEIELDKLLTSLLEIVIANAGATKCVLLVKQDHSLKLVGLVELGKSPQLLSSIPLQLSPDIPMSLVNNVKRTLQPLVIEDARKNSDFVADDYIQKYQPTSILCIPIINQRQLIGVLYLENKLTVGAFTSDRIEVLNLICSQAAISLENARLYQAAQQALIDLQHAQIQIIQSEKMSALGNLVAGIAHEINNPVSFLSGNIRPALDYINDLFHLLDIVQEQYPELDPKVQQQITAIELDYIREDLPQLVGSMTEGVKRIQDISRSLRNFSRADQDYPVACNIHDGIDSTLMILRHRLKANNMRPEIQVIKDYGDLPPIQCYAGQLNQVFMNILSNAIDALEESNQGRSYGEIRDEIIVKTELSDDQKQVIIRIKDNGIGMSQQLQDKIFDHLFTTKAVGKGTGLGLAIARQIIVEKHSGIIEVSSSLNQGSEFMISIPC